MSRIILNDEIQTMTPAEIAAYTTATTFFEDLKLPSVVPSGPHCRTVFVSFDGTQNNRGDAQPALGDALANPYSDGNGHTSPDILELEVNKKIEDDGLRDSVRSLYLQGVGTQGSFIAGQVAFGTGSVDYARQALSGVSSMLGKWRETDANCQVYVVVCGFSRGSATARYFLNLVNEYGIPATDDSGQLKQTQDTNTGAVVEKYAEYDVSRAQQPPGSVRTAALLYDTVATGQGADRADTFYFPQTIPDTTDVVVHITSADERRKMFPAESILNLDGTYDKRLLEVTLPGVHSDIGGGYSDGVGVRKLNLYFGQLVLSKLGIPISAEKPVIDPTDAGMWRKHDSSTLMTDIASVVLGRKRGLIALNNPLIGESSQTAINHDGDVSAFNVPPAIASKYDAGHRSVDGTSPLIYSLMTGGAVASVTGHARQTAEILKFAVRNSSAVAADSNSALSQQKLVVGLAGGVFPELAAHPELSGAAYREITELAQAMLAANTTFAGVWAGAPFIEAGDESGNIVFTRVPGNYDSLYYTLSSLYPFDKGSAFNTLALFGKTAKAFDLAVDPGYASFKEKIRSMDANLRVTLDYFDGSSIGLPVVLGSALEDATVPQEGFEHGRLYGFKDGGGIRSAGGNTLIGEVGYTQYVVGAGDTVDAVSLKGGVWFEGEKLTGGQWNTAAQQFESTNFTYKVSPTDSSSITVASKSDPTQAITLVHAPTAINADGSFSVAAGYLDLNFNVSDLSAHPIPTYEVSLAAKPTSVDSTVHPYDFWMIWASGLSDRTNIVYPTGPYNLHLTDVASTSASWSADANGNVVVSVIGTTNNLVVKDALNPLNGDRLGSITFSDGGMLSLGQFSKTPQVGLPASSTVQLAETGSGHVARTGLSSSYLVPALASNTIIDSYRADTVGQDALVFGAGVSAADLSFSQDGDDLLVVNTKKASVLRVTGFLGADIDTSLAKGLTFADGSVRSFADVQASAMANGYSDTPPRTASDIWKLVVTSPDAAGTSYTLDISAAEDAVLAAIATDRQTGMVLATDFFKSLLPFSARGMADIRVFREHIIAAVPADAYAFDVATQPPPPSDYYALQNTQYQMPVAGGSLITGGGGNSVAYGGGGTDTFNLQQTNALQLVHAGSGSTTVNGLPGLNEIIDGGNGNDVIYTSHSGKAFVNSGKGDDVIVSTPSYMGGTLTADTTYFFARGFGADTIFGEARSAPSTILFDRDIDSRDVAFTKLGADLVINVADETGSILVRGYFAPGNGPAKAPVNALAFADGVQLGYVDILAASVVVDPLESVLAVTRKLGLTDDVTRALIGAYGDVSNPGYGPAKQLESFVAALTSALGLAPAKAAAFNLMQSLIALDTASGSYSVSSALDYSSDQAGIAARANAALRHALMAESPFVVTARGSAPAAYPGVVDEALDMPAQYWADRADVLRLKLAQAGGAGPSLALGEQRHDTSGNPLRTSYSLFDYTTTSFVAGGATPNGVSDTTQFLLSTYLSSSLVGGAGVNHLYGGGTGYSQYLDGSSGTDNLFVAGPMYTTIIGGHGFNSFYARAHTFITNGDRQGLVTLSSAIDASKVGFAKSGNDLHVHVSTNAADDIVIKDWFGSGHAAGVMSGGIQSQNADGSLGQFWSQDDINASFVRTYTQGQGAVTWNAAGQVGTVMLGTGITSSSFAAVRKGNDLKLNFANPADSIVLQGWFSTPDLRPQLFEFSDGTHLSAADLSKYADVPQFGAGDGIVSQDTPSGAAAVAGSLLLRCASTAVVLRQVNYYNLEVTIKGTTDVLTIQNYFVNNVSGDDWKPPSLKFLDGVSFAPSAVPVEVDVWRNSWVDASGRTQTWVPYEMNPITFVTHNENVELSAKGGDTTFVAGSGTETFYGGGAHNNTFKFNATSGVTTVNVSRYDPSVHNIVEFDNTVAPSDVLTRRDANDNLVLTLASGKELTLNGFFASSYQQADQVQFADGTVWTAAALEEKLPLKLDIGSGSQTSYITDAGLFVQLGAGLTPADLVVTTDVSGGIKLSLTDGVDSLDLPGWYPYGGSTTLPRILRFADGTVWDDSTLQAHLVNLPSTDGSPSLLRATSSHPVVQGFAGDNQFWGGSADATLIGGSGSNSFFAGSGNTRMQGGPGINTFYGASGTKTTYVFGTNPTETDTANLFNGTEGKQSILQMAPGINASDVTLAAVASFPGANMLDLVIGLTGRSATFTATYQFSPWTKEAQLLDQIQFADGTTWSQADILKHFQPSANADGVRIGSPNVAMLGTDGGDILQAGDGSVTVLSGQSSSILLGGTGNDNLVGAYLPSIVLGGTGNNTVQGMGILSSGQGNGRLSSYGPSDVVLFNQGDGHAQVQGWSSTSVISLGGGVDANDVTVTKNGQDLIISAGAADDITLSGWYWGGNAFGTLQVFEDSASPSTATGTDAVHSAKVAEFNLAAMGQALADFAAAGSSTTSLHLSEHLTQFLTSTSDTQAFGGDVAHFYAANGALQGMDLGAARGVLADPALGSLQQLHSLESLRSTHNQFQILGST